jgi:4'-phosphopantetheinyl transferase
MISPSEKESVVRKYHVADARMSLGSALLKRTYIAKCTGLAWKEIILTRKLDEKHGKPCWAPPLRDGGSWPRIDFNVSHQHGLVVLVGICIPGSKPGEYETLHENDGEDVVDISVDLTSPAERSHHDIAQITSSSFQDFMTTYDTIFSDSEVFNLTYTLPVDGSLTLLSGERIPNSVLGRADRAITLGETFQVSVPSKGTQAEQKVELSSELIIESKLRTFYTAFCLKEAYFKLGGEGIAADWIKELEFNGVRAPERGGVARCSLEGTWGEKVLADTRSYSAESSEDGGLEILLRGEPVRDVLTEVQSYEENYIISTMLRTGKRYQDIKTFPEWERINLELAVSAVMGS